MQWIGSARANDEWFNGTHARQCQLCDEFLYLAFGTKGKALKFVIEQCKHECGKLAFQWSASSREYALRIFKINHTKIDKKEERFCYLRDEIFRFFNVQKSNKRIFDKIIL